MTSSDLASIKVIVVKGCLDCPYSEIRNPDDDGGKLWCSDKHFIGKMKDVCAHDFDNVIYRNFCMLTDLSEFRSDVENFVRYCYGQQRRRTV